MGHCCEIGCWGGILLHNNDDEYYNNEWFLIFHFILVGNTKEKERKKIKSIRVPTFHLETPNNQENVDHTLVVIGNKFKNTQVIIEYRNESMNILSMIKSAFVTYSLTAMIELDKPLITTLVGEIDTTL